MRQAASGRAQEHGYAELETVCARPYELASGVLPLREVLELAGSVAAIDAMSGAINPSQAPKERPFVLVHPAWHGGWCWKKVTPLLQKQGHSVSTPTLTGLGDRSHLADPRIGLDVHVSDVVNVLQYDDLRDVVLVGHSSSGAVITGVADRAPDRIAQLIYLDAFVPEHGQSVLDLLPPDFRQGMEKLVETEGKGWLLPRLAPPPWETIVRDMFGVTNGDDVRWMLERLGPTPFGHFKDPVHRTNLAAEKLQRTYIRCRNVPSPSFDRHAEMAQRTAQWRYRELATSHHPAITAPEQLTTLLLEK